MGLRSMTAADRYRIFGASGDCRTPTRTSRAVSREQPSARAISESHAHPRAVDGSLQHAPAASAFAVLGEPTQHGLASAAAAQQSLFGAARPPVLAAWGAGGDSTAMLIELIERGETVDWVLFADTGSERPATYGFVELFRAWLRARVPCSVVRYTPSNFKNWPAYRTLAENCLTNSTLPSIAFGSCSQKSKIAPQNRWTEDWPAAREIRAAGAEVIKPIGHDCSPADTRVGMPNARAMPIPATSTDIHRVSGDRRASAASSASKRRNCPCHPRARAFSVQPANLPSFTRCRRRFGAESC